LGWLERQPQHLPALYCGRTRIMDEGGRIIGLSPHFPRPPCFENALVQSIAGGNTMVMNGKARDILVAASRRSSFVSHDWWAYKIISGSGGVVHYEAEPSLSYRQHGGNAIGSNSTWRARMVRLILMASGRFVSWNDRDVAALKRCEDLLDDKSLSLLHDFENIRIAKLFRRLRLLSASGIHRQTMLGQGSLYLACFLRRI
jgi:hypothetical protein